MDSGSSLEAPETTDHWSNWPGTGVVVGRSVWESGLKAVVEREPAVEDEPGISKNRTRVEREE